MCVLEKHLAIVFCAVVVGVASDSGFNGVLTKFQPIVPTQENSCKNNQKDGLDFPKCIHMAYVDGSKAFSYDEENGKCTTFCERLQVSAGNPVIGGKRYYNKMASQGKCPTSYYDWGTQCLFIGTKTASWLEAKDSCKAMGGHLALIRNQQEQDKVETAVAILDPNFKYSYWIGGLEFEDSNIWKWDYGNENVTYTNWGSGQPNNVLKGSDNYQQCIELYTNLKWNDYWCTAGRRFVCQIFM